MIVRRLAALTGVAVVVGLLPAAPALAHGAPISPISHSAACAAGGGLKTGTTACKAALKANGGPFGTFDDVRVPNVDGNDRKFVPDGQLCGGGLAAFKGLNIARDDFPATDVTGGETLNIKYRTTAAHQGSFRVYISNQGYDPTKKLTWDDLGSKPITDVANPPQKDGSFVFSAKLPQRTGRQMLYIVWQTSNTPDSYYSCSDLVFPSAAGAKKAAPAVTRAAATKKATKAPTVKATAAPPAKTATAAVKAAAAPAATTTDAPTPQSLTPVSDDTKITLGHEILIGAVLLAAGALAVAVFGRLRRKRFENR